MLEDRQKCLETRMTAEGFVRRRYLMNDGTRLTTFEVPATVLAALGRKKSSAAMQTATRGSDKRSLAASRRTVALRMFQDGETLEAIGRELGITGARVGQILKT